MKPVEDTPMISSLSELEGKILCWTFFAGRPLRPGEGSSTRNMIQLPEVHRVVRGKLEQIFHPDLWIGDVEDGEWYRAEEILISEGVKQVWSPVKISTGSILLEAGKPAENKDNGQVYRNEGIQDARGGCNPESMFDEIVVQKFLEKIAKN